MKNLNPVTTHLALHPELEFCSREVFLPLGLDCSEVVPDPEAREYAGHTLRLGTKQVVFRVAKTTPTKAGQFVTLWQRSVNGPIRPFGEAGRYGLFLVAARHDERRGLFIFSAEALEGAGVLSVAGREGKRAFRLYSPWDTDLNRQAQRTQRWQAEHYLDLPLGEADLASTGRARTLFSAVR